MPLPKLKDIKWVTTDCYGTLIDWEKGIADAFKKEADRDGLTIDDKALLERFFTVQAGIMSGSYELYAEVLRRAAVTVAEEIDWTIEPSRAQFLPDSVAYWPPFREANAAFDRLRDRYEVGHRLQHRRQASRRLPTSPAHRARPGRDRAAGALLQA